MIENASLKNGEKRNCADAEALCEVRCEAVRWGEASWGINLVDHIFNVILPENT